MQIICEDRVFLLDLSMLLRLVRPNTLGVFFACQQLVIVHVEP